MRKSPIRHILLVLLFAAPVCRADQLVMDGKNYVGARIMDLKNGKLYFRKATGQELSPYLSEVSRITVDRDGPFKDFNEAEAFGEKGEVDKAIERYRRAQRLMSGFWQELVDGRILGLLNTTGRLHESTRAFIKVARGQHTGPALVARMFPTHIPNTLTEDSAKSILDLAKAGSKIRSENDRAMFTLLRYEILRKADDKRAATMTNAVSQLTIDVRSRTPRVYNIKLEALRDRLWLERNEEGWSALDQGIKHCPDASLAGYLLLKGKILKAAAVTDHDLIRASWPLLRVAIHKPNDPLAGDALYEAAGILEKLDRAHKAIALLEECLSLARVRNETRKLAIDALDRLKESQGS